MILICSILLVWLIGSILLAWLWSLRKPWWQRHDEWADRTFGERGPESPLNHLKEEVEELLAEPEDLEEYGDALLLILSAAHLAGYDFNDVVEAAKKKAAENEKSEWLPHEGYWKRVKVLCLNCNHEAKYHTPECEICGCKKAKLTVACNCGHERELHTPGCQACDCKVFTRHMQVLDGI